MHRGIRRSAAVIASVSYFFLEESLYHFVIANYFQLTREGNQQMTDQF